MYFIAVDSLIPPSVHAFELNYFCVPEVLKRGPDRRIRAKLQMLRSSLLPTIALTFHACLLRALAIKTTIRNSPTTKFSM